MNNTRELKADAYTDGSYNKNTATYGCGVVLLIEGMAPKLLHGNGVAAYKENGWNINGEIRAAEMAIAAAVDAGVTDLTIHHDYEGVGKWPDHQWNANKTYTIQYARMVNEYRKKINIRFSWVKGHSSNKYNDLADELAKYGAGITDRLPDIACHTQPEAETAVAAPDVLNPECRKALRKFLSIKKPSFKDFAELKTGGRDRFSYIGESAAEEILGKEVCNFVRSRVNEPKGYASALRWVLRGLSPDDAAHKVNVDLEISANSAKSR